ncbi:MAG TPA: S-adenosylmethionine:tRNA ribosyltransferase-isomerase, partial [Thermoanaerobaculia bacterium]
MKTDLFDYFLPPDRIAQEARPRGTTRLLALDRRTGAVSHCAFAEFPSLLRRGDVLVRNDVAVRNARLWGRDRQGRLVELFLLAPLDPERRRWSALAKPGRRAKRDREISLPGGARARIGDVHPDGRREAKFDRPIDDAYLEAHGAVPLPPYIRREPGAPDRPEDRAGYQTVFAREPLAVAAPTAGLHFTPGSFEAIRARGAAVADLTLAVGAGTFKPVIAADVEEHAMEPEEVSIPPETLQAIRAARASGGRVVAVGTTVARSLEAAARLPPALPGSPMRFATDL